MIWIKSKICRWTAGDFRITEDADGNRPFRLESAFFDNAAMFATLDEAKGAASIRNELELVKADNLRLRAELAQRNGVWPDTSDLSAEMDEGDGMDFGDSLEAGFPPDCGDDGGDDAGDDGRGIPALNGTH